MIDKYAIEFMLEFVIVFFGVEFISDHFCDSISKSTVKTNFKFFYSSNVTWTILFTNINGNNIFLCYRLWFHSVKKFCLLLLWSFSFRNSKRVGAITFTNAVYCNASPNEVEWKIFETHCRHRRYHNQVIHATILQCLCAICVDKKTARKYLWTFHWTAINSKCIRWMHAYQDNACELLAIETQNKWPLSYRYWKSGDFIVTWYAVNVF